MPSLVVVMGFPEINGELKKNGRQRAPVNSPVNIIKIKMN